MVPLRCWQRGTLWASDHRYFVRVVCLTYDIPTTVITVVLVLYDRILTFSDEVEYIWGSRGWLNKLIFLVNRYTVEATLVGTTYGS